MVGAEGNWAAEKVSRAMNKTPDFITGDQFGSLTVISGPRLKHIGGKSRCLYKAKCNCGAVKWLRKESLKIAASCGCQNIKIDLTGQRFGRLTILSSAPSINRKTHWNCVCECGQLITTRADSLIEGNTQSCGCLRTDRCPIKHGHNLGGKKTRTYTAWAGMKQRCLPNHRDAYKYHARGIGIDPRWLQFENFLADVDECPEGMSIDRYPNNNGNYEPGNTRWATPKQQANNTRRTIKVFHSGSLVTISDLVEISGKKHGRLYNLIVKRGFSAEEAIAA